MNKRMSAWIVIPACAVLFAAPARAAGPEPVLAALPFKPGERLVYEISWSNIIEAGTAVMEVKEEKRPDGRTAYHLISRASSKGLVSRFYKIRDTIESVIDPIRLSSLSFHLHQRHGKRKKRKDMTFDHAAGTVRVQSNGKENVYAVPDGVQDALSSLYYVRARKEFIAGKPIIVNVHEDGKTWAVEVHTLGREKLKTAIGEVNAIKIKTYPRYEGVFLNKGEIYIWLTDDDRKIPVLMKSTISIGSIVSTLVHMERGEEKK